MRETLITAAHETYAEHLRMEGRPEGEGHGFDGWLVAIRAFVFLVGGMLAISLATVI